MKALQILALIVISSFSCFFASEEALFKEQPLTPKTEVWITVFVHGIMSIKPHLTLANFWRFLHDDVEDTVYAKTVDYMRLDPYFYQNQAMQGFGLESIKLYDFTPGNSSSGLATIFDEILKKTKKYGTTNNHYYTYGWSGLMSPTIRYEEAKLLYSNLMDKVIELRRQGINPKVRVIGYSHGATVCLNLGGVHMKENPINKLEVEELILLGMPVQIDTDYCITSPLFKNVYHVASHLDRIQVMDFFSPNQFFSGRFFNERSDLKIPSHVRQIQFKVMRTSRNRDYLNTRTYNALTNFENPAIISGRSKLLRDSSPGHGELWFFGWTPNNYREHFPLNPLPSVALMPLVMNVLSDIEDLPSNQPIIVDIRPEHDAMIIKNRNPHRVTKIANLLPYKELEQLKKLAYKFAPKSYTEIEYKEHIRIAHEKAKNCYATPARLRQRLKRRYRKPIVGFNAIRRPTWNDIISSSTPYSILSDKHFHKQINSSMFICCARVDNVFVLA